MSIQKKSLISTLKTTKKANVAKENLSHAGSLTSSVKSAAIVQSAARVKGGKPGLMKSPKLTGAKWKMNQ